MIKAIKDKLISRLNTTLLCRIGRSESPPDWINGYQQAINDSEKFLDQLELYEPYTE